MSKVAVRKAPSRTAKTKPNPHPVINTSDIEADDPPPPPKNFIEFAMMTEDSEEELSDDPGYGNSKTSKKRKLASASRLKRSKKKLKTSKKALESDDVEAPEMSDNDSDEGPPREDEFRLFDPSRRKVMRSQVKATLLTNILRIEVASAPAVIHISLGDLFGNQPSNKSSESPPEMQVIDLDGHKFLTSGKRRLTGTKDTGDNAGELGDYLKGMRLNKMYASFLELQPELRNLIYRDMLVSDSVINFGNFVNGASGFPTQAPLLRACRQVYNEASDILYGENAFHFCRKSKERGRYWAKEWTEVGYKDIRRFLETIGPFNIAKMRFLSMHFDDANTTSRQLMESPERKFVNDPVVMHLLRLIANAGPVFEKFVVIFHGRSNLCLDDISFLRALTLIRCQKFINTCTLGHSRIQDGLAARMKGYMEVPGETNIDHQRRKSPRMHHHGGVYKSDCSTTACRWRRSHDGEEDSK